MSKKIISLLFLIFILSFMTYGNGITSVNYSYNSQDNIDAASGTTAAELYRTNNEEFDENLQNSYWLKEY
jgi:hypothetical protein